jgi:tape measure domain-containing protein
MADSTLTKELRIKLKFITDGFKGPTQEASDGLKKLDTGFKKTAKSAKEAKTQSSGFVSALKTFLTIQAGREALNTALAFDRVSNRMKFATTSVQDFNEAMKLSEDTANSFGLALIPTQRGLATLEASAKGTSLAGKDIEELFIGISQASGALSLTADETNSVFLAFSQIISKGKVQAEELRSQIGERIPGALKLAERALGVTGAELDKLLQSGSLMADDLLPKLAQEFQKTFGEQAGKNANSLTAQLNKLQNSLKIIVAESVQWH